MGRRFVIEWGVLGIQASDSGGLPMGITRISAKWFALGVGAAVLLASGALVIFMRSGQKRPTVEGWRGSLSKMGWSQTFESTSPELGRVLTYECGIDDLKAEATIFCPMRHERFPCLVFSMFNRKEKTPPIGAFQFCLLTANRLLPSSGLAAAQALRQMKDSADVNQGTAKGNALTEDGWNVQVELQRHSFPDGWSVSLSLIPPS